MLSILTQTLRLVARRWPQLLAWFLAGWLARYLLIELAAQVGATFALGGLLLLPLAILARLVSFVAMFLVLRDDMPNLRRLAASSLPETGRDRRAAFLDAVLVSILPFFAFYYAWGMLRDDFFAYSGRALELYLYFRGDPTAVGRIPYSDIDRLEFDALTIGIIVAAFAGRWALKRWRERIPRWTALVGVYLEAVWVFLTVYLIAGALGSFTSWWEGRQALAWLAAARDWVSGLAAPLGWIWDGVEWILGQVGDIVLQPIAWLAIAGVIYGRAIAARAVALPEDERVDAVRRRYASVPARVRRRLGDVSGQITARFRPLGRAFVLIWHAGAIPMGLFILGYTVVMALQGWLRWGITGLIGPQDVEGFWYIIDAAVILAVVAITEPLRIAVVAAAYDHALGGLTPAEEAVLEAPVEDASGDSRTPSGSDGTDAAPGSTTADDPARALRSAEESPSTGSPA